MPYLQLDVNGRYPVADKRRLAAKVSETLMMMDIRRGRPAELRMAVAQALCEPCIDILGLREDRLNVEFTEHGGDEMYHPALGGYSPEWAPGEST